MQEQKQGKLKVLKSIKVDESVWKLVKENKDKTYLPIGVFFEEAAKEKLENQRVKSIS
jgi:hypothetical protein